MNLLRIIFTLICALAFHCVNAQWIEVSVVDSATGMGLPNVLLTTDGKKISQTTPQGIARVAEDLEGSKVHLHTQGYADTTVVLSKNMKPISMLERSYSLPEVSILGFDKPHLEWTSKEYHVSDFAFLQNTLLVLAFEKEKRWKSQEFKGSTLLENCVLIALDENRKGMDTLHIPDGAWCLNTSWLGHVFLTGTTFHLVEFDGELKLHSIAKNDFESEWSSLRYTPEELVYRELGNDDYPERQFYLHHEPTSYSNMFCAIRDSFSLELLRSEWKYLSGREKVVAFDYASKLHVDKEIVAAYMRGFQQTHYYEPVYAQLFPHDQNLVIVDLTNRQLQFFTPLGSATNQVKLNIQAHKGWKLSNEVVYDDSSKQLYIVGSKHGVYQLFRIDLTTGNLHPWKELTYRNVVNMKVSNDKVFYTYRTFESSEKLSLFSEVLPAFLATVISSCR